MREILFRGKRIDNGEWIEGYFVYCKSEYDYEKTAEIIPREADRIYRGEYDLYDVREVDPDTVGQYTGRTDKNGKKVFEHDILQIFTIWADGTVEKCGVGIVQWWENDQCYVLTTKEGYHIEDFGNLGRPEYYEVIGNIHDNPELIGERKDNENRKLED